MTLTRSLTAAGVAVLLVARLSSLAQDDHEKSSSAEVSSQAVGAGRWQSQRDGLGNRDWQVQIERFTDDSVAGSLIVVGSPQLHKVRLEARVDNGEVYGVLVDDSNQQVGTFTGAVFEGGVSGTYTTADGDSGSWSWAGQVGTRALKQEPQGAAQVPSSD